MLEAGQLLQLHDLLYLNIFWYQLVKQQWQGTKYMQLKA